MKMQIQICTILTIQLVFVLVLFTTVFLYTIITKEQSISESVEHGEAAVATCFDQYLASIMTTGEEFVQDISMQLTKHVEDVMDYAEAQARSTANAVERMGYMDDMESNGWYGSSMLPAFAITLLNPLERGREEDVVVDVVVGGFNATEEYNNWVWFGLSSRNPNPTLGCDFYYYRNATDAMSSLWCIDDLYKEPDMPSPSVYPHPFSPAIVALQNATICDVSRNSSAYDRPLTWMPLSFFVWTNNEVALTSVVSGVFGPDGECQGFAAANVRFSSMSTYLASLVESARYDNLSIALIEPTSEKILGTSFGKPIYTENQTTPNGETKEVEIPASLDTMDHPIAKALHMHIELAYGGIEQIPAPLITSAKLHSQQYFLSFQTISRPNINLTICTFIPHESIMGPAEMQRYNTQIMYEESADELEEDTSQRLILGIIIGISGLMLCAIVASIASMYLSLNVRDYVDHMKKLRAKISNMVDMDSANSVRADTFCEPLPKDFFPMFGTTGLKDINQISEATNELCSQMRETWNENSAVVLRALEQRQFTASIAHDIRNPLHGVLGIVSLMEGDLEAHKDKLPLLADTLNHMAMLLNDMVDLSKIQGGKVTNVLKSFDIWVLIHEVHTLFQSKIVSEGGTLRCMDHTPLPPVYSDPVHVQRILTNFVTNAAKYAAGCEIILKVVLVNRKQVESLEFLHFLGSHFDRQAEAPSWSKNGHLKNDQYVVLGCLDKGRGIPSSKIDTIFDAYQQTCASDRYQGAGLGLAIAKGLAVDLGGGIGVQAQEGSGSLFWLVVPCSSKPQSKKEKQLMNSLSPKTTGSLDTPTAPNFAKSIATTCPTLSDLHILVVDDTNLNLMLLKNFLKRLYIGCETATSASDALVMLRKNPQKFNLIISDFHMPEMSGGEMCLEVRSDQSLCHLPFICSSGNSLKDELDTYEMDDTLMKPFTVDQLREIISRHASNPSRWSVAPIVDANRSNGSNSGPGISVISDDTSSDTKGEIANNTPLG